MSQTPKFSVLMSVYFKEDPSFLAIALKSIWDDQMLKPDEIVIVKDGPLTEPLDKVVADFAMRAPVKIVALKENQGLGKALAEGVKNCSYDYIARMDSDDISLPDRFEKQFTFLSEHPEIAICGSAIDEFLTDPSEIISRRVVPTGHDAIMRFLKMRNPFNHMTVVFRKKAILDAGNYQPLAYYEDYWLWARCLAAGQIGANLPESLLHARVGNGMYARRRGWTVVKSSINLDRHLHKIKVLSFFELCRNIFLRTTIQILPVKMVKMIYNTFLRKH